LDPTLPNFLIIGAQKAGSSWLAGALRRHPDVFIPKDEVHFFDKGYNWQKGTPWYAEFFRDAGACKAVGEKTPDYLFAQGRGVEEHLAAVHHNIRRTLPDVRLIAVLRNPVARAISAAKHILRSGRISPIHSLDDLLLGGARELLAGHGVLEYGRYARQLEAYREIFPTEQLKVLIFEEDIVAEPLRGLADVCQFLEIEPDFPEWDPHVVENQNTASRAGLMLGYYLPPLRSLVSRLDGRLPGRLAEPNPDTLRALYAYYRDDNERLFEWLGRRVPSWLS
jgi:hypothetical protein